MYSRGIQGVKPLTWLAWPLLAGLSLVHAAAGGGVFALPSLTCDTAAARAFAPPHPQLGRFEVCTTPEPLEKVNTLRWPVDLAVPLEAFGAGGLYNRAGLSRLYGGRRAHVARGWTMDGSVFESLTLISPYPDPGLTELHPGTLIIRWVRDRE
jgi:hypothetical protein